jgi:hypothetical protein
MLDESKRDMPWVEGEGGHVAIECESGNGNVEVQWNNIKKCVIEGVHRGCHYV